MSAADTVGVECQYSFGIGGKDLGTSPKQVFDCQRLLFTKGTTWVCKGVEELDAHFQQSSVAGMKKLKEDHNRAILKRGSITTHIRCTQISRLWICECSVVEGSHGCVGDISQEGR